MTKATFFTRLESLLLLALLFLQVSLLTASPTAPALKVSRRAGQFPEFPSDFEGRVKKGEYLRGLMLLGNAQATRANVESPFQDPNDAVRWGWTLSSDWYPFKHTPESSRYLKEALKALRVDETQSGQYSYYHNKIFTQANGKKGEPTGAAYINLVNPSAGVFIFDNNISPAHIVKDYDLGTKPDLYALSDLAVFQWLKGCQHKTANPKNLKVIFRTNVIYQPTSRMVVNALREIGHKRVPGSWQNGRLTEDENGFEFSHAVPPTSAFLNMMFTVKNA
ncbi:hypothetical protein LX36DRAFT_683924 [Colletotrichum falcatum]|nr:hypothetical protein LX36DRAFT_683924 [Colletotrichum falcatum]